MSRFNETPNYGGLVSRTVEAGNRGFLEVLWEKRRPILSSSLQLQGDIVSERIRAAIRADAPSGVIERRLALQDRTFLPTRNDLFVALGDKPNEFLIQGFTAIVNGYVIEVRGSRVNGGSLFSQDWNSIQLNTPPVSGQRTDLVFLEVWPAIITADSSANKPTSDEIYPLGNRNWGDTYFADDLIDTSFSPSRETDARIQLQYQFRIVNDVSRALFPDPMLATGVKGQGNNGTPSSYSFVRQSAYLDAGLYIAGDGSATARSVLGSVTGFVWAIPLCLVARRNSEPYALDISPNGGQVSVSTGNPSDRDDGVYFDEVIESDIEDLRHQIILGYPDLTKLANEEMLAVLKGTRRDIRLSTTGSQQSAKLIETDTLADVPTPGFTKIGEPDGVRSRFITKANQTVGDTVIPNTADSTGQVRLTITGGGDRIVTVEVDPADTIVSVEMRWRNNQQLVATTSTSTPFPYQFTATLNKSHGGYQPNGTIDVVYEIAYGGNVEFAQSANEVLRVEHIDSLMVTQEVSFVEEGFQFRQVQRDEVVPNHPDFFQDFNFIHADYQDVDQLGGFIRLETLHLVGNGSNSYIIPDVVGGRRVVSLYKAREVSVTPVAINPVSLTRNGNGTYTVVFSGGFTASKVLEFTLVVDGPGLIWSRQRQGVPLLTRLQEVTVVGNGTDLQYVFQTASKIHSLPSYEDILGNRKGYAYIDNQRRDVTFELLSENVVRVTIPSTTTDPIIVPFIIEWQVPAADKINITFDYFAYGGLSSLNGIVAAGQKFDVVGAGQPIANSLGAGDDVLVPGWLQGAVQRLPRASASQFDFTGRSFRLDDIGPFGTAAYPRSEYIFDSAGQPLQVGQRVVLVSAAGSKEQGLSGLSLTTEIGEKLNLRRPVIDFENELEQGTVLVAYPFLLREVTTGTIYFLVLTVEISSEGQDWSFSPAAGDTRAAFDMYTTRDRWLIR